jgi:hypothetical protein
MTKQAIIEELIDDLCLLSNDGLPDMKSSEALSYISEFFTMRGMSEVGMNLIQNLTEADQFKNPALNKVIQYKTVNGEDAEGKVGNLLRRPKEEDAHQKALKALGGEGSDTYKKAMDDLGGENQPGRDIEKEKEKKEEPAGEAPAETEQPKPNAFDPNTPGGKDYLEGLPDNDAAKPDSMKAETDAELENAVDRKNFSKKNPKTQKDAPNGPTQQEILDDLNEGNIDKISEYHDDVENSRAKGIAGAGGAVASEGESKYCNACNLDKDQWRADNQQELASIKEGLRGKRRNKEEKLVAASLGYNEDDEEFLDILAEAELYSKQKTAEVEADEDSVLYKKGKKGFADAKVGNKTDPKGAYSEWMKAGYFGSIATKRRLDESKLDTSQPHKVVQSTPELDDAVEAHFEDMYKNAETKEDKAFYKKQLEFFKKFRTYHDTFAIGKDANGRTVVVSITNKKDSEVRDPQNNTTPAQRLRFIKASFGEEISERVSKVLDNATEKVASAAAATIQSQSKMKIDDDVVRVCDEPRMAPYMEELDAQATDPKFKFAKFLKAGGKDWNSLSTKEKLESMQEYMNSRLVDKDGNSRIITEPYIDEDGESVDSTFYIDDDGNKIGPIKGLGDPKIGLPSRPFGKIAIKLGEFGANEETKGIKKTEKDLVTEVHTGVTNELFDADAEDGAYHPTDRPDADNGKNTQGYIAGTMQAMHIDTYIDLDDEDDDAVLIQMGVNGVKPSMVRDCVAEKSGYTGDTKTPEGRKGLKEFLLKRCRVTPGGEKISVVSEGKEVEMFTDQWRTAGDNQKVASYFGKDMRDCLQEKAKFTS